MIRCRLILSYSWAQKFPHNKRMLGNSTEHEHNNGNRLWFRTTQIILIARIMTLSCKCFSKNEILVQIIKPTKPTEKILDFLRLHYYTEEPLTAGSEPKQQDKEDEDEIMLYLNHGTSFMAFRHLNENSKENLLGVLISAPKKANEADKLFRQAAKWGPTKLGHILQFSACVERDANAFARFHVQKVLHIHVLVVNREERGKNIGFRLVQELLVQSRKFNFELLTVDCTSFYSAKLFERMGFQCINIKYYKDYVDADGKQVFKPDLPHKCVKTFAFKLKE